MEMIKMKKSTSNKVSHWLSLCLWNFYLIQELFRKIRLMQPEKLITELFAKRDNKRWLWSKGLKELQERKKELSRDKLCLPTKIWMIMVPKEISQRTNLKHLELVKSREAQLWALIPILISLMEVEMTSQNLNQKVKPLETKLKNFQVKMK
jgi:hypothetical protein